LKLLIFYKWTTYNASENKRFS